MGDKTLVAPVVNQGMTRRMVYPPEGKWFTHRKADGLTIGRMKSM